MIWKVIGTICSLSFFVTGFSVLGDPDCVTAEIGGGRVIGVTCRADAYGTWSGGAAAFIMLLIGIVLLAITFLREIRNLIAPGIQSTNQPIRASNIASSSSNVKNTFHLGNYVNSRKSKYKQCAQCKAKMTLECIQCGETHFTHKRVPTPVIEATPEFKTCPMCAEEIKFVAKKCRYCQHMMEK